MTLPIIPYTLLEAIAREEGWYVQPGDPGYPTRPQRNNNPGDLEWHAWMAEFGSTKGDPRFAIFPTVDQGWACLRRLLTFSEYRGKTLAQAITEFAPGNENNTHQYILNVCSWCEVGPDTVIDGILG
jgi:hypothetical protein